MSKVFEDLGHYLHTPKKRIQIIKTKARAQALLDYLDDAYVKGDPIILDSVYDDLRLEMEEKWPTLESKIGHKTDDDNVRLPIPMASLNQYRLDTPKLLKGLKKKLRVSDKLDGQSVEIVYKKHKPVEAYTRGDALEGKDISHHIKNMNIPKKITSKNMTIRFEAIIPVDLFYKHLHEDVGGKYTVPRNAVSGMTRSFKPLPEEFKYIHFVAFGIIGGTGSDLPQSKQFALLKQEGFEVVYSTKSEEWTQETLQEHYDKRMLKSKYELDGVVCTRNVVPDVPTDENPKHAFKFKMNSLAEAVDVKLLGIKWQASKYGKWTPVGIFKETKIGGVMVQRCTLHNAWYVLHGVLSQREKNQLQKPKESRPLGKGAVVKIVRSGKVIPYVIDIIKPAKEAEMPESYRMDGVHAYVEGDNESINVRLLTSFFTAIEFKDQGPSTAQALNEGGYASLATLYGISEKRAISLLGNAKGKALIASINSTKESVDIVKWLTATAPYYMRGSSTTTFQKILDEIPEVASIESSYELLKRIEAIKGIKSLAGQLTATIIDSLSLAYSLGVKPQLKQVEVTSDKLHSIVAGFSGLTDKLLMQEIIEAGGAATRSMTNATNVLIVKDTGGSSSKIEKARSKGIPVLTPNQFREQYLR